jgi:UDP-2,3-diacylglucosamine hydrolase
VIIRTAIISDLHLDSNHEETYLLFVHLLKQIQGNTERLYIAGDLFEKWIGDDDNSPFCLDVVQQLKNLSDSGVSLFIMHGNRDFLLGKGFIESTQSQLLSDPAVIDLYGEKVLLSHGDLLCTDDRNYQILRRTVRKSWLQKIFLALPLSLRSAIGHRMRKQSQYAQLNKSLSVMDANPKAIQKMMSRYEADLLIHGHTHRPNLQIFLSSGQYHRRIVLSDWGSQGNVLFCYPDRRKELRFFSKKDSLG